MHASRRFVSSQQARIAGDVTWSSGSVAIAAASETDDALLVTRATTHQVATLPMAGGRVGPAGHVGAGLSLAY